MQINRDIRNIHRILKEEGFQCYIVGGAVRNHVAGIPPSDYDLATDARPEEVQRLFRRTIPTGIDHGTVTVLLSGGQYEITTFRTESTYSDGRHPDAVAFSSSLEEDLMRRDFTMNALAWDIGRASLIDLYDGVGAIRRREIVAIGEPEERFTEDPLRIMRACRFAAQLNFQVEKATRAAASAAAKDLLRVSAERIRDEFFKLITAEECVRGLRLMEEIGILSITLPELSACKGVEQPSGHAFDVYEHSLYACEGAPREPVPRLAALLHDIGKAEAVEKNAEGGISFYHHEEIGARMSSAILRRLKASNNQIHRVSHLIRMHMFNYTPEWSDSAVRRFLARVGVEFVDELFALRRADAYAMQRRIPQLDNLLEFQERIRKVIAQEEALSIKDLAVNGNDLAERGIPKNRMMGVVLEQLLEAVLDDPSMNSSEQLLPLAENIYRQIASVQAD